MTQSRGAVCDWLLRCHSSQNSTQFKGLTLERRGLSLQFWEVGGSAREGVCCGGRGVPLVPDYFNWRPPVPVFVLKEAFFLRMDLRYWDSRYSCVD